MITRQKYQDYINVLKEELIPAMGCTEPIAIAYAGAIAREHLGCLPAVSYTHLFCSRALSASLTRKDSRHF